MRFGSFLRELHRRSVWQVLGGYALVTWIILRLSGIAQGIFGLPTWFGPATVVVVLLGFPVLLITTLVQGGFRKEELFHGRFGDSADGGDESLSSWRSLERSPVRDALRKVFTWRNALAGGIIMAVLLGIGVFL